eukprot:TRINITY_DN2860_c5_g1_i1.p1 TRINITY_DN2860_c5_g1~~TRINITY_DN2860_c5_g1_i1.p1  ORF type:complete len:315 (-),score=49.27 TRINITY_DN2860_c5_g1_i1:132-971(-)
MASTSARRRGWLRRSNGLPRLRGQGANVSAPVAGFVGGGAALLALVAGMAAAFEPALELDMPCSTMACPVGYERRWDAAMVRCQGACNVSADVDTCCLQGHFSSYSWRVLAVGNVSTAWELSAVRFYLSSNCSDESLADAAPGVHHKFRGWPSGAAFSNHRGHGALAARLFGFQPVGWTSGGPCEESSCFVGFKWESDIDRYPLGECRAKFGERCASEGQVRKAGSLRVACAEVEQSAEPGRFAEELALQLQDAAGLWRTVASSRGLSGGLARVKKDYE